MSRSVREQLRAHPPRLVAGLATVEAGEPARWASAAAGGDDGAFAHVLACPCGGRAFRVLGVPATMTLGGRGYVLRSALRVWRELRAASLGDEAMVGRLSPPIELECARCKRRHPIEAAGDAGAGPSAPLEALRCRPCRRSSFEAAIVCIHHDADLDEAATGGEEERWDAWRLAVRCRTCGMLGEPFEHGRRSAQQRRIDRLYGRRGGESEE